MLKWYNLTTLKTFKNLNMEKKSIVQWCKNLHEAGNELTMKWEGGGDSGWVYFEVDGESTDNEYTRALIDQMDNTLNYGSWAGEFNASGEATYDAEKNAFEGTDFYGEDTNEVLDVDVMLRVPKKLWFDTLHVEIEANYDETPQMSVRTLIKNGFLSDQHTVFCSNLEEVLKDEFRSCTDSWILERADAVESGDDLLFYIKQVDISVTTNDEKDIMLELDEETVKAIDHILNEKENAE